MKIINDNETLLRYIPNSIKPVAGETALFDKITVHLKSAEKWVEQNFTGSDLLNDINSLDDDLVETLQQLVAAEALNRAIPALDLVLTPNGFGVVNTNTVAAASKQRVDRLIGSVREQRDTAVEQLLTLLPSADGWLDTPQASFFAATLFPNIDLTTLCGETANRWEKYLELRSRVIGIEQSLAEEYFSQELMCTLRGKVLAGTLTSLEVVLVHNLRSQIVDVLLDRSISTRRMMDCVNTIRNHPDIFPDWHNSTTAKLFSPPKFENKKDSAGYFF